MPDGEPSGWRRKRNPAIDGVFDDAVGTDEQDARKQQDAECPSRDHLCGSPPEWPNRTAESDALGQFC